MSLQWTDPQMLWGGCAIPLLLLLHWLRTRRRVIPVASLLPWQSLSPRPFAHRTPLSASLLIALLTALLLSLALGGPIWNEGQSTAIPLILDTSPSMQAQTPLGSTRAENALATIDRIKEDLGRDVLILSSPSGLLPGQPFLWLSDTPPPKAWSNAEWVGTGGRVNNLGLLAAHWTQHNEDTIITVHIGNTSAAVQSTTLTVLSDQGETLQRSLQVDPEASTLQHIVLPAPWAQARTATVRISPPADDALSADDQTVMSLPGARRVWIDRARFPRIALALQTAAGCRIAPDRASADVWITSQPSPPLPRVCVLIEPERAALGWIPLPGATQTGHLRILTQADWPQSTVLGLGEVTIVRGQAPAGAEVLIESVGAQTTAPFWARWTRDNHEAWALPSLPAAWTAQQGFAVHWMEWADRIWPRTAPVPGLTESMDDLMRDPPPTLDAAMLARLREFGTTSLPLRRPLLALSGCLLLALAIASSRSR